MEKDVDQDMFNVLKYNQDRFDKAIGNAQKAIQEIEESHKKFEEEYIPYDFVGVDNAIAESLGILQKFEKVNSSYENEEYVPTEYHPIILEDRDVTFDELLKAANEAGYTDSKIEDILTSEEIAYADARYQEIEDAFAEKTRLNKNDMVFLITAIALQVVRQYFITPLKERPTAEAGSDVMKDKYGSGGKMTGKYYYAPESTITGQKRVPYDVIAGSKNYELGKDGKGLDGNSHRFRTLGHDPILGYVFGTANIMTNTMTMWNVVLSFHIKYIPNESGVKVPTIAEKADTGKIFDACIQRFNGNDGKTILVESIVKEYLHLKSDKTTDGLPLPFLSLYSPDLAQTLAEHGIDSVTVGQVGKQAAGSAFINFIIGVLHGLMCTEEGEIDRNLYKVRTRKILLISNSIASVSNVIAVGIAAGIGVAGDNPAFVKKSINYLDVGGLLVTITRIFSDVHFITRVKDEFIHAELDKDLQVEIDKIDSILDEINSMVFQ